MNYKSELQANNEDIQALIEKANALPDAGSGGGSANEITGTLAGAATSYGLDGNSGTNLMPVYEHMYMTLDITADTLLRAGSTIRLTIPASALGDAMPSEVARGTTFTSINGIGVEGLSSTGGNIEINPSV